MRKFNVFKCNEKGNNIVLFLRQSHYMQHEYSADPVSCSLIYLSQFLSVSHVGTE